MIPKPLRRLQDHPDAQDLARLALSLRDFLPLLKRYAKQEGVPFPALTQKAVRFYCQHREGTLDPAALKLIPKTNNKARDARVMVMHAQGKKSSEIAGSLGISASRVRQIVLAQTAKGETFKIKSPEPTAKHDPFDPHDWDDLLPPAPNTTNPDNYDAPARPINFDDPDWGNLLP